MMYNRINCDINTIFTGGLLSGAYNIHYAYVRYSSERCDGIKKKLLMLSSRMHSRMEYRLCVFKNFEMLSISVACLFFLFGCTLIFVKPLSCQLFHFNLPVYKRDTNDRIPYAFFSLLSYDSQVNHKKNAFVVVKCIFYLAI